MNAQQQAIVDATMCYAARLPGWPGYVAVMVDPGESAHAEQRKWLAQTFAEWVKHRYGPIEHVTRAESVAGLQAFNDERKRREQLPPPNPIADLPLFENLA